MSEIERAAPPGVIAPELREIVVVVPAHNERERLPGCLANIAAAAEQVSVPVQVVVVLDTCTDGSEYALPASVAAVRVSLKNVGASRAAGFIAAAPTPDARIWLATTDADSLVPTTWLVDHVRHYRELMHAVVGTVSVDWREHSAATQRRYERRYLTRAENHGHVHGANLGVRADAYWRVGGFRPLQVGEDVDLVARLVGAGSPLAWDSDSAVLTSDRRDCRARGGFGDYLRVLAEEPRDATSVEIA